MLKDKLERFAHYRLGIDAIDIEHYALYKMMDKALSLVQSETSSIEDIVEVASQLRDNMSVHFDHELKFMGSINYPWMMAHATEHQRLLIKFDEILRQIETKTFKKYAAKELIEIFLYHIDTHDMQITHFLNKK